jgi:hypothetical protein
MCVLPSKKGDPMNLENEDMRKEERFTCEPIEFFSVEFNLGNGSENEQAWELNVLDCSKHGLRLLVTDIDEDLLKMLKPGDVIKDITFYGESTFIRVDATVRHITKIGHGAYQGQHAIGVESDSLMTSCLPMLEE